MLSSVSWEHYKDIKPLDNPLRAIPMREKKKVSKELKKEGENRQEHLPLSLSSSASVIGPPIRELC